MRIKLIINDPTLNILLEFEHLLKLFFSNIEWDDEEPNLTFNFHIKDEEKIRVIGTLFTSGNQEITKEYLTREKIYSIEKEKRKKQAVEHVLLLLLEEYTKEKHAWGILTGIRPTKLYHKLLDHYSSEQVQEILARDFLVKSEKIIIMSEIINRQYQVIPDLNKLEKEVSIYIGIPFCPTRCAYCTFPAYAINTQPKLIKAFLQALDWEIETLGRWLKESGIDVTTVYFGGGTPTSLTATELDGLLTQLFRSIPLAKLRELTVEAGRPDSIDQEKLTILKKWQVERISINPQTFKEETLQLIGRHHSVKETIDKFVLARELGFNNINMDLIIGLPGEKIIDLQNSLNFLAELKPDSITIHSMAFKRGSKLTLEKELYEIPEGLEVNKMIDLTQSWMKQHLFNPYYLYRQKNILGNLENIGYAQTGKESIYNILIMEEKQTIIGLGSGAVSKIINPYTKEIIRIANPKEPQSYINNLVGKLQDKVSVLNRIINNISSR